MNVCRLGMFTFFLLPVATSAQDGSFGPRKVVGANFDDATGVYAADLDGDGDNDVLGAAFLADDVTWWENVNGDGSAWIEHTIAENFDGANSVHAADVDHDDDIDVLATSQETNDILWWENTNGDGSAWTEHTIAADFDGAILLHAVDIDGDDDCDVAAAGCYVDAIAWWENTNGDGTAWLEHPVSGTGNFNKAMGVYVECVDNDDAYPDILGAARLGDEIAWWENTNGDGTAWTKRTIGASFSRAHSVHAADLDGDLDVDVVGAAETADEIAWWENTNGDGTAWTKRTIDGDFDGADAVRALDLDDDGDVDVIGCALYADSVAWWENVDGSGTAWTKHVIDAAFDEATSLYVADLNGDGRPDVLSAASAGDQIAWWQNYANQPIPTLSEWGLLAMTLLVLAAGTVVLRRRRETRAA